MRRALLVGIDNYDNFTPLRGCVNDVDALRPMFERHEDNSPNFEVVSVTSDRSRVTKAELMSNIVALLAPGADVAVLYFAGHGQAEASDVTLCTTDGQAGDEGVAFSRILSQVRESKVGEVIIILDCCFSGGAGGTGVIGGDLSLLRPGVAILSASRADQPAGENNGQGVFSFYLGGALDGGASDVLGHVTVATAYSYLSESLGAWSQRPTFKSNLERLNALRKCEPAVPLPLLRRLPSIFPTESYELPLDPSYEPDAEPDHPEHEEVFSMLQKLRAAKLLEPVGNEHMYYAAINSLSCRLTRLGRHYWRIAARGAL
ncbi:caspase family protein [Stenotrophomonas sp. GD03819]|uniref:caspase family protein n=1 Tax=Stenotrophomonas sp. GD03819 TaxID=2975384 RepID=UPI002449AE78|nr:caspase family protein [Stenotrophomonas sp. GD03819]MDH1791177.1 caspase family protein [Stenotrophomonas sp. GD03819]MDJ1520672.1 caspase family protein [Stenotrophomonas maltophilia]